MTDETIVIDGHTKSDSVTLKRNAKGDMAWDIKLYFNADSGNDDVLDMIDEINEVLKVRYI